MLLRVAFSLQFFFLPLISAEISPPASYQSAVGSCLVELRKVLPVTQSLDYFVGTGWDNLRNVHTRVVLHHTFNDCLATPEGSYLIPDNVIAIPVQETEFDQMATFHESFTSYFESATDTINVGGGFGGLFGFAGFGKASGSYSKKHQKTKLEMATISSNVFITKMKAHSYSLLANVNAGLDPDFKERLMEIVAFLRENVTQRAMYEAQLIIRDYGTHYISRAEVGLVTEQMNYVSKDFDYKSEKNLDEMKAATAGSFHAFLFGGSESVGVGKSVSTEMKSRLSTITRHVRINTQGGPSAQRISSCRAENNKTCTAAVDNLVPLDHEGEPLFTLIIAHLLKELHPSEVDQLSELIQNATAEYYQRNIIPGCTDPKDINYSFKANINDGTCKGTAPEPPPFGGVFQTCEPVGNTCPPYRCNEFSQMTSIVGSFSCPSGYLPALITDFVYDGFEDRVVDRKTEDCHRHLVHKKCKTNVQHVVYKDKVRLRSYSCVPTNLANAPRFPPHQTTQRPPDSPTDFGYLFGGLYSTGHPNLWTNGENCPPYYFPVKFAGDVNLCQSRDKELGGPYKVPLNGFYSCKTPAAQQKCSDGYSSHLATITPSQCEVYYCIRTGVYKRFDLPQIKRPPFLSPTVQLSNISDHHVRYFENNTLILSYPLQEVLDDSLHNETQQNQILTTATSDDISDIVAKWIQQKLKECGVPPNIEAKSEKNKSKKSFFG